MMKDYLLKTAFERGATTKDWLARQRLDMTLGACVKIRCPYHFLDSVSLAFLRTELLCDVEVIRSHLALIPIRPARARLDVGKGNQDLDSLLSALK